MTTTRRTLAEFNEKMNERIRTWGNYQIRTEAVVGQAGARRTGTHIHVLWLDRIVDENGPHKPGTVKIGDMFSIHAACGTRSNGQRTAYELKGKDTDTVTCERCLERFGWEGE